MSEQESAKKTRTEEEILEQQFLRAATSFEAILLSQIEIKKALSDRLNYSIRTGITILAVIAISILILLLTLSAQLTRISGVVMDMNNHFTEVTQQMKRVDSYVDSMETRVALISNIDQQTGSMGNDVQLVSQDLTRLKYSLGTISQHVATVRGNINNISGAINRMDDGVQLMSGDMHRMSKPARTMNKMFPFP